MASIEQVAEAVVRRAQRQAYVVPREVRAELRLAGLDDQQWKDVVTLAKTNLFYRQGRYYYAGNVVSPRLRQEQEQHRKIHKAIDLILKRHRTDLKDNERRGQTRVDFIQAVTVQTEHGNPMTLLSRDLSATGIRLLGTHRLLGQKVRVDIPQEESDPPLRLLVRILWTCSVGDGLFESGGNFLEIVEDGEA